MTTEFSIDNGNYKEILIPCKIPCDIKLTDTLNTDRQYYKETGLFRLLDTP